MTTVATDRASIVITLDDGGIVRQSGKDQYGRAWVDFEVDTFAGEDTGRCVECGAEIDSGWLCLDGGDEACVDCVIVVNA